MDKVQICAVIDLIQNRIDCLTVDQNLGYCGIFGQQDVGVDFLRRCVQLIEDTFFAALIPDIYQNAALFVTCDITDLLVRGNRELGGEPKNSVLAVQVHQTGKTFVDGFQNVARAPGTGAGGVLTLVDIFPVIQEPDFPGFIKNLLQVLNLINKP